jgi:hypothetical protein
METFGKIVEQVRELTGYTAVQRLSKGFSFEEKYVLSGRDSRRYLVRITVPADQWLIRYKQTEFEIIRRLRKDSSLIPEAYAFGTSDDGSLCFMVLDFIEGTDGEVALNGLSDADQYRIGVQAGKEQKKILRDNHSRYAHYSTGSVGLFDRESGHSAGGCPIILV